ncbi:MAG: MotA/TolQ/ExbB proton channel family protein [Bdellovibrionaceae bacterium]|nr:MotA/TolQ/ExbB proton channel family protein [Pseudobdellovibrionaceae bacterium]
MFSSIFEFLREAGVWGGLIVMTGCISIFFISERIKVLYFQYGLDVNEFSQKINQFIHSKKLDEAIVLCSQLETKPMARAFKTILEKADRDDETIFQTHDNAMSEIIPLYTRRLHYLSMLANVATMIGLLGTISGLITSFKAVAKADAALKQQLLSSGIAESLNTTLLGLVVAIPAMVFFSILTGRQNQLIEQTTEKCGKLTELLTSAHLPQLNRQNVFPDMPIPPSVQNKVS